VLSGPKLGVRTPGRGNCSENFGWRYQPERRLCHGNSPFAKLNCS
jgi:hypothetical protein